MTVLAQAGYQWAPVLGILAGTVGFVGLYGLIAAVADRWQDRQAARREAVMVAARDARRAADEVTRIGLEAGLDD